ncbi:antitoxin VbhA family protein [Pseudomonas putida]|uniref:antitoxin VbhA family protein n=1 Tax=Pseudomonas putida TaxID=303 RepID=UPI000751755C|nr:antitoxin VbhA family protein [Pseudomonas putida]
MDEQEQRRQTVARVLGCQALEGLRPSAAQRQRLERYVAGETTTTLLAELRSQQAWRQAGRELRPEVLTQLLEQWLQDEPEYPLAQLVVLDPGTQGQPAYEALLGVLRQRGLTEIDWHSSTSLAIRSERYNYLSDCLQRHLANG